MALTALLNLINTNATQQGSADRITGVEIRTILNAIVNTIQGDVAFSNSIPFDKMVSKMATHQLVASITLSPNTSGAVPGFGTVVRIIGGGSYSVNLSGFKKSSTSGSFVSTNGTVNVFAFVYDGTDYWYSVFQEAGTSSGSSGQLAAPTLSITSGTTNPVVLDWNDIANATNYPVQRAADAAFTQNVLTLVNDTDSTHSDGTVTPGTLYYYRVKAVDQAGGYTDSAYSNVVSVTVASSSSTTPLTIDVFSNVSEEGTEWVAGGSADYSNTYALADQKLPANTDGFIEFDLIDALNENVIIGFNKEADNVAFNGANSGYEFFAWKADDGRYYTGFDGTNTVNSNITAQAGDKLRVSRTSGVLRAQYVRSGVVNQILQFSGTYNGDLFINFCMNGAAHKASNPVGSGVVLR